MALIDFRLRPNTAVYMEGNSGPTDEENWRRPHFGPYPGEVELSEFLARVEAVGVDLGVFTCRQMGSPESPSAGITNDYVAECVAQSNGRLVGFASADPTYGDGGLREIRRCIADFGFRGISIDPQMTRCSIDDAIYEPQYQLASELGLPVVITMGPIVGRYSDPWAVDIVAEKHPDVTFVCSHGCWPQVTEFLSLLYRRSNVVLEASIYYELPGAEPFIEGARTVFQDQVVYASAFPFNPIESITRFRALGFPPDVERKLTHDNAARILGLGA